MSKRRMFMFGFKTKKVDFDESSLRRVIGRYEVYQPETKEQILACAECVDGLASEGDAMSKIPYLVTAINSITNLEVTEDDIRYELNRKFSDNDFISILSAVQIVLMSLRDRVDTHVELDEVLNAKGFSYEDVIEENKNRNDKTVILEKMKKNETERKAQEIVDKGIEDGHIVEVGSDHIAEVSKKVDAMTDDELNAELVRLEKIAKIKKLQAELGE